MSLVSRRRIAPLLALSILLAAALPAAAVSWGPVLPITTSGQAAALAGSTAVYTGGVALAYREQVGDDYRVYVKRSIDGGTTWTAPRRLSSANAEIATGPSLASSGLNIHAAFVEYRSDGSSKIIYRRSEDGGESWSAPLAMSSSGTRAGIPSITRTGTRVVLAWTNELTGVVSVRVSTNGGLSFNLRTDIATSTNRPFLDQGSNAFDAFPTVAISGNVINVGYYTSQGTLSLRRSSSNGSSWTTAITLASNGNGYKPILTASGSTIVVGYAIYTGTDVYSAFRRSTNNGASWSTAAALSGKSAPPSYQPVISVRLGTWRISFERCLDDECTQSDIYYRESTNSAASWTTASRASDGPGDYQSPVGVTFTDEILVTFMTYDIETETLDIVARKGS